MLIKGRGEVLMKAEILAVGTEILLGDIINTNAQFIITNYFLSVYIYS